MVEKSGAQNITTCENQGNATWTEWSLKIKKKTFFFKVTGDNVKKDKKTDWNTSFNKKVY